MAARGSAPVLGALCSSGHGKAKARKDDADRGPAVADAERITAGELRRRQPWVLSAGFRYQPSSTPFIGTVEQPQPQIPNRIPLRNVLSLFDVSIERQITSRFSVTASLPIQSSYRNQPYTPAGQYRVHSIGDMTAGVRAWLFRPPTESGGNIAVGASIKLPTGKYNATGLARDARGQPVVAPADQSVQAGDGGTGFTLDVQAYQPVWFGTTAFFSGSYLFNPRDTNGVSSGRTRFRETVNSVPDGYLARGGVSHAVPGVPGLVATFGGRWEGVPVRDLIGRSNGFRRPGYAISADPGILYARWGYVFSVNVPWAVERNLRRSVPELTNGFRNGDSAAFADYLILVGFSRRF